MQIAKGTLSYRKADDALQDKSLAVAVKSLMFAHKFTAAGTTDLDLTALTAPSTEIPSWVNPSAAAMASANLYVMPENLMLISSLKGHLTPLSFDVISNTLIRLKNGAESDVDEIIFGMIKPANISGVIAVDGRAICQTGVLSAGNTDIVVGDPFTYNKYSATQVGDVLLFIDGILQARCVGNVVGGEGNYFEVQPSAGSLSNTLRMKTAPLADVNYMVVSNGLVAERPTAAVMAKFQTLGGTVDQLVQDVALATGNPTSRYQTAPNEPDLTIFGDLVKSYITEVHYDLVVGSAAQVAAGKATHTSLVAAIAVAATDARILVLQQTLAESISVNKRLSIEGKGYGSYITGTLNVSADGSSIRGIKFGDNISVGANNCFVRDCWQGTGKTISNTGSGNSILVIQE